MADTPGRRACRARLLDSATLPAILVDQAAHDRTSAHPRGGGVDDVDGTIWWSLVQRTMCRDGRTSRCTRRQRHVLDFYRGERTATERCRRARASGGPG